MQAKCPLCGQTLPSAIDEQTLQGKLDKLTAQAAKRATEAERRTLKQEFEDKLAAEKEIARQRAEREFQRELKRKQDEVETLSKTVNEKVENAKKAATLEAQRSANAQINGLKKQLQETNRNREVDLKRAREEGATSAQTAAKLDTEKAKLEHTREILRLQDKVANLSRQLEKKSGEQFGEEGEFDLFSMLQIEFPKDKVERIGRGVKGADILQTVMDGDKEAGCIVYESKNVSDWQNAFLTQAKKYHTLYETPYVMIVSRVLPSKKRGMCVVEGMPVVDPKFASTLAGVMRDGILETSKLRLTRAGASEKAQELYSYVIGNEFQTRFADLADAVDSLRDIQKAERTWHENHWTKEGKLDAQIESRHREINAQIESIAKAKDIVQRKPMAAVASMN